MRPYNHVHSSTKSRFRDRWNCFLNNRAIAAYFFIEYFLCLGCIVIVIHYLTQKTHFHFPKLVNISSFHVNCSMLLEPVPTQPLPFDQPIIQLLNKHENNNLHKVTTYAISLNYTNYSLPVWFAILHFRSANGVLDMTSIEMTSHCMTSRYGVHLCKECLNRTVP